MELKYYLIYKPYMMLSQFSSELGKQTLADLNYTFPKDVYPVGRLDEDSEGLLILTNDKLLNHKLLDPKYKHIRTYLAQVDGDIKDENLKPIFEGVDININGFIYKTIPAKAKIIQEPENIRERVPPIRVRKNIPTSWISLTLEEGKNRQVRKMTAKIGYPTLRLIRTNIEGINMDNMTSGEVKEIKKEILYRALNI